MLTATIYDTEGMFSEVSDVGPSRSKIRLLAAVPDFPISEHHHIAGSSDLTSPR